MSQVPIVLVIRSDLLTYRLSAPNTINERRFVADDQLGQLGSSHAWKQVCQYYKVGYYVGSISQND